MVVMDVIQHCGEDGEKDRVESWVVMISFRMMAELSLSAPMSTSAGCN